ncbi:MAG: restriction endonuclease [Deltaproteobacteria bacterium]|nr:restriction endonuclease [Deltaproteobacteria bacterium]
MKYAVQVKRYTGQKVSRRAVSDAVAGKAHYGCTHAMVVTNSTFTPGARLLAGSTGCELIDRYDLLQWMHEAKR